MNKKKPTVGSLFSGVGGIDLGFIQSGFDVNWAIELDKHACVTYKENFKHSLIQKDINLVSGKDLSTVDVLCAGFPCQPFSLAGHRKGFEDERGNIFFQIIRLINELRVKPKVLFLENVKNFKQHDNGNTFKTVLNIIQDEGYSIFFDILNTAEYTPIPQNRERTFLICFKDEANWEFSKNSNLASKKFLKLFPPPKARNKNTIHKYLETKKIDELFFYRKDKYNYSELKKSIQSQDTIYQWRRVYVRKNQEKNCPTLTANMGTGGHNVPLILTNDGIRKLTPRECFNFQGFPKHFKIPATVSNSQLYKQAGNSVTVPLIKKLAMSIRKVL